jgi:hypothetical protein
MGDRVTRLRALPQRSTRGQRRASGNHHAPVLLEVMHPVLQILAGDGGEIIDAVHDVQ